MEEEITLRSADGTPLHARVWPAGSDARAAVALVPGYADHSGRYGHVARFLNEAGFAAYGIDLRGHGRSGGARGHVARFTDYIADADELLKLVADRSPDAPLFMVGHSMGGLVTLLHMLERRPAGVRGFAVSSPFLGVAVRVPAVKAALGRVMSKVWPGLALPSGIDPADLSRDPEVGRAYAADPLVFRTATARWYTEAMGAIERVKAGAARLDQPLLVMQAGEDRLADPKQARPLFDRLASADKTYISYPGFYHEIFNETEKERPLGDLREWIMKRI